MSLIETEVLDSLLRMAKEKSFMQRLIESYLHDAKINIDKIESSASKLNYQKIIEAAHTLDGSSRSIGAKRLSIMADKIFKLAKSRECNSIAELIEELNHIYDETKVALQDFTKYKKQQSHSSQAQRLKPVLD